MKAFDVVGHAYNGAVYCRECFGDGHAFPDEGYGPNAIFASEEGWMDDSCDGCGMTLGECV